MAQDDATELLERESALVALRAQIQGLSSSGGGCALIVGDAGIGKTSLLRALRADVAADVVWWMGSCEPLLTPPPLAPWLDMLPQLPPRMAEAVRSERVGSELFADMLSLLQTTVRPLVIVVEDVHWADGATRDLLRFLGRRIRTTRALLILSWREHELGPAHPLRNVLAGLDAAGTQRHVLAPLSPGAVARLARSAGRDAEDLYRASAGNPFFVRQLLAAPVGVGVPAQVRDALLARVAQLPEAVREVLEMVSLSPVALELDVLRTAIGPHPEVLQAALHSGLLRCEQHRRGDALSLIHDITRATLAESLGTRAAALHAALFDALGQHAG